MWLEGTRVVLNVDADARLELAGEQIDSDWAVGGTGKSDAGGVFGNGLRSQRLEIAKRSMVELATLTLIACWR